MAITNPKQTEGIDKVEVFVENKNIHLNFDFVGKQILSLDLVKGESESEVLEKLRKLAFELMRNREVI